MPNTIADRAAVSFRPSDGSAARFWCSGRGTINHLYLKSLAIAAADPDVSIQDVMHGQKNSYYASLSVIEAPEEPHGQLALDDADPDFPGTRRHMTMFLF